MRRSYRSVFLDSAFLKEAALSQGQVNSSRTILRGDVDLSRITMTGTWAVRARSGLTVLPPTHKPGKPAGIVTVSSLFFTSSPTIKFKQLS